MTELSSLFLFLSIYAASAVFIGMWAKLKNWIFGLIGFSLPILLAAFRYVVGTDFWIYLEFFNRDSTKSFADIFINFYSEGGFHSIAKISSFIGDERVYFGAAAALTMLPVVLTYRKVSGNLTAIFTFLFLLTTFTTSLNIMRQGIAIAFTFVAAQYIFERNIIKFGLWIAVAMLFHLSAIIFAPAYFLFAKDKLFNFKRLAILVCVFLIVLSASSVIDSLQSVEGIGKYSVYSEGDERTQNRSIILTIFLLILFFAKRKKMQEIDGTAYTLLIFSVIGFLIELTGSFSPFIKRSGMYFSIYNIVLACQWIRSFPLANRSLSKTIIVGFFVVRFIVAFYALAQANIIPYNTKETYYGQSIL